MGLFLRASAILVGMWACVAAAPLSAGEGLKPFRVYSDFDVDDNGEGSGYTLWLWKEGRSLRGFLTYKEGSPEAAGTIGELEIAKYDPKTGAFSFSSRVEACSNAGEGFKFMPVAAYGFKGKISAKEVVGVLKATLPDSDGGAKPTKISLPLQSSEPNTLFREFPTWQGLKAAWHHCP